MLAFHTNSTNGSKDRQSDAEFFEAGLEENYYRADVLQIPYPKQIGIWVCTVKAVFTVSYVSGVAEYDERYETLREPELLLASDALLDPLLSY